MEDQKIVLIETIDRNEIMLINTKIHLYLARALYRCRSSAAKLAGDEGVYIVFETVSILIKHFGP